MSNNNQPTVFENQIPMRWIINDLLLTIYSKRIEHSAWFEPVRIPDVDVQIITHNHGYTCYNHDIIVKDFEIIVDGTTYDRHEIAKRLRVPNLELDYYDIDINKDHNVFMVKSNKRHIIRKIE